MSRLETALAAADAAGQVALSLQDQDVLVVKRKADGSVVTDGDLAAERAARAVLAAEAKGEPVLGEEEGGGLRENLRDTWIIDPIDGTEHYRRGRPIWASLVAWHDQTGVALAVIDAPALKQRWWASRNGGAHTDLGAMQVSPIEDPDEATLLFGGQHEYSGALWAVMTRLMATFGSAWGIGNFWSHVLVASGQAEVAVSHGTSVWDVAAPSLLVSEAGGLWGDGTGGLSLETGTFISGNRQFQPIAAGVLAGAIKAEGARTARTGRVCRPVEDSE